MVLMRAIILVCLVLQLLAVTNTAAWAKSPFTNRALIDGFNKTVFGSEYSGLLSQAYVRKFSAPVRFYVRSYLPSTSATNARHEVETFILSLNRLIRGLNVKIVSREKHANFVVHLVNRKDYAKIIRTVIFKRTVIPVRGRCMVRSLFTRNGISRSDAVIVVDEGRKLFKRCMTEEILQGLGPLNDDRSLSQSMFNDTSLYTSFRRFDRFILNMLYDPQIKNGSSRKEVQRQLPKVLYRVRANIEGAN